MTGQCIFFYLGKETAVVHGGAGEKVEVVTRCATIDPGIQLQREVVYH